jgi:hypothetical protein
MRKKKSSYIAKKLKKKINQTSETNSFHPNYFHLRAFTLIIDPNKLL